jgi:cell division protein YceG involved in septum cleavage
LLVLFIIIPIASFFAYFFISGPAPDFKVGEVFEINEGMNVSEIAGFLEKEGYIKSASIFKLYDR